MRKVNFVGGNQITLLQSGAEFFPALIAHIDGAQQEIYLETYIFATDETAQTVQQALMRAAARGVTVRMIIDWIGSGRQQSRRLQTALQAAGVQCRIFNPWFRRGLARTHRKLIVCDGNVALVGGINIQSDMLAEVDGGGYLDFPRWDFAVELHGNLVAQIRLELVTEWLRLGRLSLKNRLQILLELGLGNPAPALPDSRPTIAAFVVRDNFRNRATIQKTYLHALGNARKTAVLVNPYFAPGRKFRAALINAASRGVEVTLLLGVGHYRLQDAVAHSFYPKLLRHGIRIVEYRKTQLHAKVAVVDDAWATVGSSNVDGLSLFVNREANVVVRDKTFTELLNQQIQHGVQDGVPIALSEYANIRWSKRMWYGFAYLVYRALMRLVTFGLYS